MRRRYLWYKIQVDSCGKAPKKYNNWANYLSFSNG